MKEWFKHFLASLVGNGYSSQIRDEQLRQELGARLDLVQARLNQMANNDAAEEQSREGGS